MSSLSQLPTATGTSDIPLSQLAASLMQNSESPSPSPMARPALRVSAVREEVVMDHHHEHCGWSWYMFILLWLLLSIFFYLLFFFLRPWFVLQDNCDSRSWSEENAGYENREINNGKLLGSAVLAALIVLFILWIFWVLFSYSM